MPRKKLHSTLLTNQPQAAATQDNGAAKTAPPISGAEAPATTPQGIGANPGEPENITTIGAVPQVPPAEQTDQDSDPTPENTAAENVLRTINAGIGFEPDELDGLTSENFSEVEPTKPDAEDEEVAADLPEDTVLPDKETQSLIADVITFGNEFEPAHTKLNTVIEAHRTKTILLKTKFGVRQGTSGHRLLITSKGKKTAMLWDEFVLFYFGVTSRRLNQLLDVKDDKDTRTTIRLSDEEKPLYKQGYDAAIAEAEKRLKLLEATPKAVDLAEQIVELKEKLKFSNNHNWELAEAVEQYKHYFGDLDCTVPRQDAPAPEPATMEAWEKHKLPDAKFQRKYFEQAKAYFVDRYQYAFNGGDFRKVLEILKGDPKKVAANAQDIQQLSLVIADAAEHLKMLATVMMTMAKAPGQPAAPEAETTPGHNQ